MSFLKKLLDPVWKVKKYVFPHFALSFFWVGFVQFNVLAIKFVTDAIVAWDIDLFWRWIYAYIAMAIVRIIMNPLTRVSRRTVRLRLQKYVYTRYLKIYLHIDNNHTETLGTWRSNSLLQKWCDQRSVLFSNTFADAFVPFFAMLFSIVYFFVFAGWQRGVVMTFFVMLFFATTIHGGYLTRKIRQYVKQLYTQTDRHVIKIIMSKFEVLSQHQWRREKKMLDDFFDKIIAGRTKDSLLLIYGLDMGRAMMYGLIIVFLLTQWVATLEGMFSLGSFLLLFTRMRALINDTTTLSFKIEEYHQSMIHIRKLRESFDDAPRLQWLRREKVFAPTGGQIIFDNVTFAYTNKNIVDWLSLRFDGQKRTALVGPSGGGKSTLIKLIAWYLHPTRGDIIVDQQKRSELNIMSYYRHIGYLTQDPSVFDGTVRDNLLYGIEYDKGEQFFTSDERVDIDVILREVLTNSQCHFVYDLPDGLDTEIGEKWVKLSWWQRQRLAIAKIMLKDPEIVLLDEPTSALDSVSEELVTKALDELFEGRTVIVVAHRLQTVQKADMIMYIDEWRVIEQWDHQSLVEQDGAYAKMLAVQTSFG